VGLGAALAVALLGREAVAQTLVAFGAPHAVRAPGATLDAGFAQRLDEQATAAKVSTPEGLVSFALNVTAGALHFGLGHSTRLQFGGEDRVANCVEYAELLASIINREHREVDAHAWVVRSAAMIGGTVSSDPAWKDHDWVLVSVRTPGAVRSLYVDPTFFDMGLGWDISGAVRGTVRPPR
jgi:hypothetical protein